MLRYLVVGVVIIFIAGCTSTLEKADRAMEKGDYATAVKLYQEVLEKKLKAPEAAEVRYSLGRAFDKLSRLDEASEEYRTAIELKPDRMKYYLALADDMDAVGLVEQEAAVLRNAAILEGKNPHVRAMLGTAYAKLGQYTNAKTEFEEALRLNDRDPDNYLNMGLLYVKTGEKGKAVSYWEDALKIKPDHEAVLKNLGNVYTELKREPDAIRAYKKLSALHPDDIKLHVKLGAMCYNNAMYKDSLEEYQKVAALDKNYPGLEDSLRLAKRGVTRLSKSR